MSAQLESGEFPPISMVYAQEPKFPARVYELRGSRAASFVCEMPVPKGTHRAIARSLLQWAPTHDSARIVSLEGLPSEKESEEPIAGDPKIWGVASSDRARAELSGHGIELLHSAVISGVTGVLLNEGRWLNYDVTALMAEVQPDLPGAHAAVALTKSLSRLMPELRMDLGPLQETSRRLEDYLNRLKGQAKPVVTEAPPGTIYGWHCGNRPSDRLYSYTIPVARSTGVELPELAQVIILLLLTLPLALPTSATSQSTINPNAWCAGLSGNGPGPTLNRTMIWVPEARTLGGFNRSFNDVYAAKAPSCFKAADRMKAFTFEGQLNGTRLGQTGDDQFAIFATDDTVRFNGREWGWVSKLTDNSILGYYQDPLTGSGLTYCVIGLAADNIRHTFTITLSAGWKGSLQTILRYLVDGNVRCSLAVTGDPQFSLVAYTLWITTHRTENSWDAGNGVGVRITRSYFQPLRPAQ